jgi:lysozyme
MSSFWAWLFYGRGAPCEQTPHVADQPDAAIVGEVGPEVIAPSRAGATAKPAELTRKQKIAAAIAAACTVVLPLTSSSEGLRTSPYRDPAGIQTVCYGETQLEMRVYSADECGAMLRARLAKDYAPPIVRCVQGITLPERKFVFAALIDASYNAGADAVCKSRMVKAINAGDWKRGCELFPGWYVTAKGKVYPGLVRRRLAERDLCVRGTS